MALLDPLLNPLLNLAPVWAIIILAFVVSSFIVLIYKLMTDQQEMKRLKDELKEYQTKLKKLKDKPAEMMKVQKEMMQVNLKYMGKSMKPTLVTFIPILLILGWMSAHLAYVPLMPGDQFTATVLAAKGVAGSVDIKVPDSFEVVGNASQEFDEREATFTVKAKEEGNFVLTFASNGKEVDKQVIISAEQEYAPVAESYDSDVFKSVTVGNRPLKVWWKLSWLWLYVLCAVVFSVVLRRLLKVH